MLLLEAMAHKVVMELPYLVRVRSKVSSEKKGICLPRGTLL